MDIQIRQLLMFAHLMPLTMVCSASKVVPQGLTFEMRPRQVDYLLYHLVCQALDPLLIGMMSDDNLHGEHTYCCCGLMLR
jgi:hypothetical protein